MPTAKPTQCALKCTSLVNRSPVYKSHLVSTACVWQDANTDLVNSIQDAINDAKAKVEDFNSREKVKCTTGWRSLLTYLVVKSSAGPVRVL